MIAIIGCTNDDTLYFRNKMKLESESLIFGREIVSVGKLGKNDIVVTTCGQTNKLSAAVTTLIIEKYQPYAVFFIGNVSSFSPKMKQGDIYLPERIYFMDVDQNASANAIFGEIPHLPRFFVTESNVLNELEIIATTNTNRYLIRGITLTDDVFYTKKEQINDVLEENYASETEVVAHDCSSGGVALACYLSDVPFLCMQAVSYEYDNERQLINSVRKGLEVMPSIGKCLTILINKISKNK